MSPFRGEQRLRFGAHDFRAATGEIESIYHPRLRYSCSFAAKQAIKRLREGMPKCGAEAV